MVNKNGCLITDERFLAVRIYARASSFFSDALTISVTALDRMDTARL